MKADIAIMIKTFERDELLFNTIKHIKEYLKSVDYRIYIADDGSISPQKELFYSELKKEGHFILILPYNVGASKGRVEISKHILEDYILRMDDDILITSETHVEKMLLILQNFKNIGVISDLERQKYEGKGTEKGEIQKNGEAFLLKYGRLLIKKFLKKDTKYEEFNYIRYKICDFTRNFLLLKKEMLKDILWDEEIKFDGEHLDFMLSIKKHRFWKLAFTPDSIHTHAGPPMNELSSEYIAQRKNPEGKITKVNKLKSKWDIYNIVGLNNEKSFFYNFLKITYNFIRCYI